MGQITDIREALADAIASVTLPGYSDFQVSAYMLANPTPPCAWVVPGGPSGSIEYDKAMQRGLDQVPFTVQVFVPLTVGQAAEQLLDALIEPSGSSSIKAAIEADRTLGGACDSLRVRSCSGYRQYILDGKPPQLGAEWLVDVHVTPS